MSGRGWIGCDFDGTIATYGSKPWPQLGEPIAPIVEQVKAWLAAGQEVRIMTARVCHLDSDIPEDADEAREQRRAIEAWCEQHIGQKLVVTCRKDYEMIELWDDRAVRIEKNKGTSEIHAVAVELAACVPDAPPGSSVADMARLLRNRYANACVALDALKAPIPMLLDCPGCGSGHLDEGEWATRAHKTHQCQACGREWRPANVPTVGVRALP